VPQTDPTSPIPAIAPVVSGISRMQQTRTEPRLAHQAPVRIFGIDCAGKPINLAAWTIDVSQHGARVEGIPRLWNGPGDVVGVRHGNEKARYKVVWIGDPATREEGQIGLRCIETGKVIWGEAVVANAKSAAAPEPSRTTEDLSQRQPLGRDASAGVRNNRRKDIRFRAAGGAKIQETGSASGQWTMLHDVSLGGCYVETTTPLYPGARVELMMHAGETQIAARGEVTVADRLVGMGVRFTDLSPLDRERLVHLVSHLGQTAAPA
jgi:hypothetical protein